ncbi:DNA processing protein [Monaibacterium marinum]|uniref:DNA processing protein n=1 Tax=Pontivivens marinum TaxID=1690039 RepID=A0A2C9CPB2_9RHOB|nr:DNA-processing protein DprA [Monaibacterium marinum]SOH93058.1 DNA processing protein [Monaibacterium marinum]
MLDLDTDLPDRDTLITHLALARSPRVGTVTFRRLIATYGSTAQALAALPEHAARGGMKGYRPVDMAAVEREVAMAADVGAVPLLLDQAGYPERLRQLPDAPMLIWMRGSMPDHDRGATAMVGARNASALGLRMARTLAAELGELGHVVVSGLARGIDTAAHEAALETGTIAVMAGGIDTIYPPQNLDLAERIAAQGALLTEAPPGLAPMAKHFPRRNRIISGLSDSIVLVEAAERSGSLITARMALEQGREVLAVPGHPFDARAAGCNRLIREGAGLVRSASDVVEALAMPSPMGISEEQLVWAPEPPSDGVGDALAALLSPTPVAEDELIRQIDRPAGQVMAALMDMELSGAIARHPGGMITLA